MLSWTKICRLPLTKSEKNGRFTTFGPISSLRKNHLAPTVSALTDNHERQRHTKKLISSDLKKGKKTKLPI